MSFRDLVKRLTATDRATHLGHALQALGGVFGIVFLAVPFYGGLFLLSGIPAEFSWPAASIAAVGTGMAADWAFFGQREFIGDLVEPILENPAETARVKAKFQSDGALDFMAPHVAGVFGAMLAVMAWMGLGVL